MMKRLARVVFCLALTALLVLPESAFADPSLPWTLRNHYSIPVERGVLIYAEDNAEWRVLLDDGTVFANSIGFSITLADGTELTGLNLGEGSPSRDPFTNELGDGTTYSVTFAPKHGLTVKHVLRTFHSRPFVYVEISVENTGASDVRVASIRPVVSESSVMNSLSPQTRIRYRSILDVAGHPVVVTEENATMAIINDPVKSFCFGIGLLPVGTARSSVNFKEQDGTWNGEIVCNYEPAKLLAPGETLAADPLWISHGVPEVHRVDLYYAWAYSMFVDPPERNFSARGWYTLDESNGLDDYVAAGTAWQRAGIDHVLLGRGWEGRPGSLSGAAPRFPKNMKSAADTLTQSGLHVGITIDPLVAESGGQAWTTDSSDGQSWLNPTLPDAARALGDKIKTLQDWGATFIVVQDSMIPDSALETFKLTRAEAQNLAYKALRKAAAPLPVYPASVAPVRENATDWLNASGSVARMATYGVIPGPLQCQVENANSISEETATAASFWPGPIEFKGKVNHRVRDDLAALIARKLVPGKPMDADVNAPRTWEVQDYDGTGNLIGERTISMDNANELHAEKTEAVKSAKAES